MNRDTTIIQVAILMIALAVLGIAIRRQQHPMNSTQVSSLTPLKIQEKVQNKVPSATS